MASTDFLEKRLSKSNLKQINTLQTLYCYCGTEKGLKWQKNIIN